MGLQEHRVRRNVHVERIAVMNSRVSMLNGEYKAKEPADIPLGFRQVCVNELKVDAQVMWRKLGGGRRWFGASNGAYIYWNTVDRHWWIDLPSGAGAFKALGPSHAPAAVGWKVLGPYGPPPSVLV